MAQLLERPSEQKAEVVQKVDFRTGNEMAARAAKQINFHLMGYYPITPSTEVPEFLDEMKAEGEHTIRRIPADGEHGAGLAGGTMTIVNQTIPRALRRLGYGAPHVRAVPQSPATETHTHSVPDTAALDDAKGRLISAKSFGLSV